MRRVGLRDWDGPLKSAIFYAVWHEVGLLDLRISFLVACALGHKNKEFKQWNQMCVFVWAK